MFKRTLTKPDGRTLELYARHPIPDGLNAPSPEESRIPRNPHMRWHPLRAEWVAYAAYRQHRTFLPPPEYNPLAPTTDPANPTELPAGDYDVAVFENLFPTFAMSSSSDVSPATVDTKPACGVCEVVVFTQDPKQTLGGLPLDHVELIVDVWADRYRELGAISEVQYVMPFENRGVEVGVTLHHPHGQIYAYPFIPPVAARELEHQLAYFERHRRGLIEDIVARERTERIRIIYSGPHVAAFMPVYARYSYEVWIAPSRAAVSFAELTGDERSDFARALKTVLMK